MRTPSRVRLTVERMEDRATPAVTASLANGVLSVTGSNFAETVQVRQVAGQLVVGGVAGTFPAASTTRIDVRGLGGNDVIDVRGVLRPCTLDGGSGADQFTLDLTTPASFNGYGTADRLVFSSGTVRKWTVAPNGSLWTLDTGGNLRVRGALSWTHKADFGFDAQNRVILLDTPANGGWLGRSKQPFGNGGWDPMGTAVRKWQIAPNQSVWALDASGNVRVNGGYVSWTKKADFAFEPDGRVFLRDTTANGGWLGRSRLPYGNGGWETIATEVERFEYRSDGRFWVYRSDAEVIGWEYAYGGQPAVTLNHGTGELVVYGTGGADTITLSLSAGSYEVSGPAGMSTFAAAAVRSVTVHAGMGADRVNLSGWASSLGVTVFGGAGNDTLYGGAGADQLYAGSGNDGLYGGPGRDTLYGQSGADRFLTLPEDIVWSVAAADARIVFIGPWTPADIVRVDEGLALMHARTNNTRLLKLSGGGGLTFERLTTDLTPGGGSADNNSAGRIRFANRSVGSSALWKTVIHEIGHNWDDENPRWSQFRTLSGWTQSNPNSSAYTRITEYGETWWYRTSSAFATDYARSHPMEDFAESFAATFGGHGASQISAKISLINGWLDGITS